MYNVFCNEAALSVFGMVGGPLLGLFSLGMCSPFANSAGAISGLVSSLSVLVWMSFGQPRPPGEFFSTLKVTTNNLRTLAGFNHTTQTYVAPVFSLAGGDDTTRPRRQVTG
jgi:sodium-coupled monocarboxylate transporter 8/12